METKFKITTRSKINARSGPGTTFDYVGTCKAWETIDVIGVEKDVSGVNWYKIKEGCYICSKFCDVGVSHPDENSKKSAGKKTNRMRIVSTQDNSISSNPLGGIITNAGGGIGNALDNFLNQSFGASESTEMIMKRRIFATPYQFLGTTDIKGDPESPNTGVGRMYTSNILREAPILSIMPCKPNYLPGLSTDQQTQITKAIYDMVSESTTDLMKALGQEVIDDVETKYFSTDVDYVEYIKYVNLLCRGAALFMGIGEQLVPGTTIPYKEYNWSNWTLPDGQTKRTENVLEGTMVDGLPGSETLGKIGGAIKSKVDDIGREYDEMSEAFKNGDKGSWLEDPQFMEKISTARYYVDFYVTPSTSYSESFSNRTEQSAFANALNKGSDMLKEIVFAMGANALDSSVLTESMANIAGSVRKDMERLSGGKDNLFSRLIMDAQTILSGANIIFPEIWHSSERNQSYRAEIKLVSPYGTTEAIYLNTLVPMFHILAFTLPRQASVNAYSAPFLIKAHINKWFSCEMGIIDSCEIQKGGWNVNGFPSEITINLSFKDLYSALPISKIDNFKSAYKFALNQSLMEYMSVSCGLNMKTSEMRKKYDMLTSLLKNMPTDYIDSTYEGARQAGINKLASILGNFGGGKV